MPRGHFLSVTKMVGTGGNGNSVWEQKARKKALFPSVPTALSNDPCGNEWTKRNG